GRVDRRGVSHPDRANRSAPDRRYRERTAAVSRLPHSDNRSDGCAVELRFCCALGRLNNNPGSPSGEDFPMSAILVFVAFVVIGDTVAVTIASMFERISESVSLLVFFALFVLVFWAAWRGAVHVTERYILRQS